MTNYEIKCIQYLNIILILLKLKRARKVKTNNHNYFFIFTSIYFLLFKV